MKPVSLIVLALAVSTAAAAAAAPAPTFTEHVAPIIFQNCTTCHRPGEAAPFALMNYADAKKRAKLIATVTHDRLMPPWKVEPADFPFRNERRLSDAQIDLLQRWHAAGAPEGDPRKLPPLPRFAEGWQLGPPDLIVKMPEGFKVPAEGRDIYRNFVLPLNLPEEKWVQAIDFRPGAKSVVHHSLFFYDTSGTARKLDEEDPGPGYGRKMGLGNRPFSPLGGWALGGRASELPEGLAWRLPKGADLILSTHFHPSGKAEEEISTVGIYFAKEPPKQPFAGIQLPPLFGATAGIDIPPGAKDYTITDSYVLPVDVRAFGVGGHAHYLAKTMKLTATLPGGETRTLCSIPDWDFAWQESYLFDDFVFLPEGTRLDVTITYDNSADNPRNPSHPPRRVRWGEQSTDEMGSMTLQVVAAKPAELGALQRDYRLHVASKTARRTAAFAQEAAQSGGLLKTIFDRLDSDGDGKLSKTEAPPRLLESFDLLDRNGDGFLNLEELRPVEALLNNRPGERVQRKK